MGAGQSSEEIRQDLKGFCDIFISDKNRHYCALLEKTTFNLPDGMSKPENMTIMSIGKWILNMNDKDKAFFNNIKVNQNIYSDLKGSGLSLMKTPGLPEYIAKILTYAEDPASYNPASYNPPKRAVNGNGESAIVGGGLAAITSMNPINIILIVIILILIYMIINKLGCIMSADTLKTENMIAYRPLINERFERFERF
jgi:hypothetical protein